MTLLKRVQQDEESILHNIMQFYIYEFSNYIPSIKLEPNGAFKPFPLEKYWSEPHLHAFFIESDEERVGFALVESTINTEPNTVLEFFIMAKYSGKGYGKQAARDLFAMFQGKWRVTQIEANPRAHKFWTSIIDEYTSGNYSDQKVDGQYVQTFHT